MLINKLIKASDFTGYTVVCALINNLKPSKMKRNEKKVPEFDEIIFENRNKSYGAFDLRRRYKSATSISILGGVVIFALTTFALTFKTESGTASTGPVSVIIEVSSPLIPDFVPPPEVKPPPELASAIKNLQPVVSSDTSEIDTFIPITEDIIENVQNGKVPDEVIVIDDPDPVVPQKPNPL